nr:MFS transporter [Actinomycetota bacterium]
QQGSVAAAGIVVSVYAVGSGAAGLLFGMLKLTIPLPRLLLLGTLGTALTTLPLLIVGDILTLSIAVFASGVFFAPTMIVIMGLVERIVPGSKLTEGMTWAITGLSIGVALGAAVSGAAVERFGPDGGFLVAVTAGAAALVIALLGYRMLSVKASEPAAVEQDDERELTRPG